MRTLVGAAEPPDPEIRWTVTTTTTSGSMIWTDSPSLNTTARSAIGGHVIHWASQAWRGTTP